MRDEVIITMPLPPIALSPNARTHRMVKAKAKKAYRQAAMALAMQAWGGKGDEWVAATAQAIFYHKQNRRRDRDNLAASLKAAWDGIVDARIITDDDILMCMPAVKGIDPDDPHVELTIRKGWSHEGWELF